MALRRRLEGAAQRVGRRSPSHDDGGSSLTRWFDAGHYLETYPDVAGAGVDPATHYCEHGLREGRRPNGWFDPAFYLAAYPDVSASGIPAFEHFVRFGLSEGRRPNPVFDPDWYRAHHAADLAGRPAVVGYLEDGRASGHRPCSWFDPRWYEAAYPDIAGRDPVEHYLAFGSVEGRFPSRESFEAFRSRLASVQDRPRPAVEVARHERAALDRYLDALPTDWGVRALDDERPLAYAERVRRHRARRAGLLLAPLVVVTVVRAIEEAQELGLTTVAYLTREGRLLADAHRLIAAGLQGRRAIPEPVHLPVSRRSTFGPSLAALDLEELMRLWRMYPTQSLRALVVSLGLEATALDGCAARLGLDLDRRLANVATDEQTWVLLTDPAVADTVTSHLAEQRTLLRAYVEAELGSSDEVVVCDLGWRGTIQDNLARVVPERRWTGCYLALLPYLNPQPGNVRKVAVGPDGNIGNETAWFDPEVGVVERVLTPPCPSSVGYRQGASGAEPVFDPDGSPPSAIGLLEALQQGLLAGVARAARVVPSTRSDVHGRRQLVEDLLHLLLDDPPFGVADTYCSAAHDEVFGAFDDPTIVPGVAAPLSVLSHPSWVAHGVPGPPTLGARAVRWPVGHRRWFPVEVLMESIGSVGGGS